MASTIGTEVAAIAFPLLVLVLTGSPAQAGLVGSASMLPNLLFSLPAGALVDRWDRKRTMIAVDAARALAMASVPLALWSGRLTLPQLLAVAFIDGTGFVLFGLSETAALPRIVPPVQLPTALARNEARTRGAAIAGSPIGGFLFGFGHALPFLADAISYAVSVLSLLFIRATLQVQRTSADRNLFKEIGEGIAWLWRSRVLRVSLVLVALGNFIFEALVLAVIVLARTKGASPAVIGIMLGIVGVGGLLGSAVAPPLLRLVPQTVILVGTNWLWATLIVLMAIAPSPLLVGVLFGIASFVGPAWNVLLGTYRLRVVPEHLLGRVVSAGRVLTWGVIPLGSLVGGVMLQVVGATRTVLILAAGMFALAVAASTALRGIPPLTDAGPG